MGTKDIDVITDSKILISQMELKYQEEEDKYLGSFANNPSKPLQVQLFALWPTLTPVLTHQHSHKYRALLAKADSNSFRP